VEESWAEAVSIVDIKEISYWPSHNANNLVHINIAKLV